MYYLVLVQPEMERGGFSASEYSAFRGGIFQASRSTDPTRIWKQRKEQIPALLFIVSMSPPGYPSAWLRARRARFRFARQDHCSSTTSFGLNFRMRRNPSANRLQTRGTLRTLPSGLQAGFQLVRLSES
jgi:hypothetical protein